MKNSLANEKLEKIIQVLSPQSQLERVWQLEGGISAQMTAVAFQTASRQTKKVIIRQLQNLAALKNEYNTLQATRAAGLPTPAPYLIDESGQILDAPYLVMDFMEGERVFAPFNLDDHMRQLAAQLAQIHGVDVTAVDLSFLPHKTNGCDELARPPNPAPAETQVREVLASLRPLPQKNQSALLHGDFWPGNTLWLDGKLTAVVDWEDAEVGDPLRDFAKSRSEIVWIFGIEAMQTFSRHYQSLMALDYSNLPYWDLCATLRQLRFADSDLRKLTSYSAEFGRDDITEQTIQKSFRYFINQALE